MSSTMAVFLVFAAASSASASDMTMTDSEALLAGAAWRRAWDAQSESRVLDVKSLVEEAATLAGQGTVGRQGVLDAMQGTIEEEIQKAQKRMSLLEASDNQEAVQLDRVSKAFHNFKNMENIDEVSRGMFLATLCRNTVALRCDTADCVENLSAACRV